MRSRYTAYALGDEDHLFRSWHPATRPAPPYCDPTAEWAGLSILEVEAGAETDAEGVVEFEASWASPAGPGSMRERSRFIRRARRWVYFDGEVR